MPEPVAIFRNGEESVTVYSDGELVGVLGPGADAYCTEHGVLNRAHETNVEQCNHESAYDHVGTATVPVYDVSVAFETLGVL